MRFSQRTNWNTEESELTLAYRVRRSAGLPIADLTASNPTRCGFDYEDNLLDALIAPQALDYDAQPCGMLSAREAVCRYYSDHGAVTRPEQIVLTTSTSEAYSYLFRLLCDSGDEVVIPQPSYPLFDYLAALDDVKLRPAPLVYDHGWQIDPEGFRRAIRNNTRAIVLVHPNNPTGHYTKQWEAEVLAELCREHDLSLIVDEVFLDFGEGKSFTEGLDGVPVFVVSGMSKIAGLPQMKSGWIAAIGPQAEESLTRLEIIADTFLSMNAPVQCALPKWLEGRKSIQEQIRRRVSTNLAELDRQLSGSPTVDRLDMEGGWYAVLRIPATKKDEQTAMELLEQGAWLHPGYFFGMPDSGWLVLSLLAQEEEFHRGVVILTDYFALDHKSNEAAG